MKIANTKSELQNLIQAIKLKNSTAQVGFVPTMGALHQGHLSLVTKANESCEIIVVSIFVNPTQFNNKEDLVNYPRNIEKDAELLKDTNCDILFYPNEKEVYPADYKEPSIQLNGLDEVMEGTFRPGHFQGVVMVVNRLFELVNPDFAFFGKKDFQQLAIIRQMVIELNWKIKIIPVEIKRAQDGLALSSRNERLSAEQKKDALIIHQTLLFGHELSRNEKSISRVKAQMIGFFNKGNLELEYLEIANAKTLKPAQGFDEPVICCIAAQCGEVRLIDNLEFSQD